MDNLNNNNFKYRSTDLENKYLACFYQEAIRNIIVGFMFTVITFDLFWLQYILPTIGAVLLYIGFRDLRKENKFFDIGWKFSIINMIINILNLIYASTPLSIYFKNVFVSVVVTTVFQVTFLFVFRQAVKAFYYKYNIVFRKNYITKLIIWRIIVVICALIGLGMIWFISIFIIIYYFYLFRQLYKITYDFDKIKLSNTTNTNNNMILNKKILKIGYIIICIFTVMISCILSNHIKLDYEEVTPVEEFSIRNELIDKGVPREIVKDILDRDINILTNIVNIEVSNNNLKFDSTLTKVDKNLSNNENIDNLGEKGVEVTSIFIELKYNKMYAIEYFNWGDEGPYWQSGIAISNTQPLKLLNGRLLFEKEGINYSAEIPRIKDGIVESTDIFGEERQDNKITGAINYPYDSINQRGYVFYKINIPQGIIAGNNIVDYINYNNPFRIPYSEVEKDNIMFNKNKRQSGGNYRTKSAMDLNN